MRACARARVRGVVALREKRGAWVGVLVRSVTGVDSVFLWVGTLRTDLGVDFRFYFMFSMRSMEVGNYWDLSRTLYTTTGHRFEGPQPGARRARACARARVRGVVALREKRGAWVGV